MTNQNTANGIIAINDGIIGDIPQQTIDAKELHEVLNVKRKFSKWIKALIGEHGFIEDEDFALSEDKKYTLSINMGKELCTIENNEQAKTIRHYLIEREIKTLAENPASSVAFTPEEMERGKHIIEMLKKTLQHMQHTQEFYRLWGRMCNRKLSLSVEKQLLYEAGEAHMDAFRGHMYLAQRSLKSALEIQVNVKFD